jgi:integrase
LIAASVSKAMERTRDKLGIKDITMHDLRRTAGTYMSQYGVPKDVRERILNHGGMRKGSITDSVYRCREARRVRALGGRPRGDHWGWPE